jgi:HlyD family secretion protein
MKKAAIIVLLSISAVALLPGCGPLGKPDDSASASATDLPPVKADTRIIAEGVVLPRQFAALSMLASGTVAEVLVDEGDVVREGDAIVRLENRSERAAVSESEAAVRAAEARLQELQAGAREQEIAAAEAKLDGAKARLARLLEDPRSGDLAAAQAAVDEAQAALDDLLDGPSTDLITEAAARRANAAAALQQAQAAYDKIKWFDSAGQLPESLQLQQATNDYEAANASYESVAGGATEAEIAAAEARVSKAEAELDKVKQSARASEVAEAEADVRLNEAELDLLQAGTRAEQVAKAEADVVAAYATLRRAQAALADSELRAPFPGTVAWLDVRVGERIDPSQVIMQLADLSEWVIETDDLTEIDVVDVQPGAPATITFDAISDLELLGRVAWITPFGEKKEGDITYTVRVCPDKEDARLRWNMTAVVSIEPLDEPVEGFSQECATPGGRTPTSLSAPAITPSSAAIISGTEPPGSAP